MRLCFFKLMNFYKLDVFQCIAFILLMLIFSNFWPVRIPLNWLRSLSVKPKWALLSGKGCPRIILYISCPRPSTRLFFRVPSSFYWEIVFSEHNLYNRLSLLHTHIDTSTYRARKLIFFFFRKRNI